MAELNVKISKILDNIDKLSDFLDKHNIKWTLISKVLSGNKLVLDRILKSSAMSRLHSIGDSRISNLKMIKSIDPNIITMYIKPPAIQYAKQIINYADISLNTSYDTILALNNEAKKVGKIHKVIIMIEMGELREGIIRDNIIEFYGTIFDLSHIEVVGLGTNLGCMYGVEPTYDKLIQLSLYKLLLEKTFNHEIPYISGGTSITLPLVSKNKVPKTINHFRIGEAVFLGTSPLNNKRFQNLNSDIFEFDSNILEIEEKENMPDGIISDASIGHTADIEHINIMKSYKGILDFGILDVDFKELISKDEKIKFIGTTSDLTVFDFGKNIRSNGKIKYKVGDKVKFNLTYMGIARLMNSNFTDKIIN